MAKTNISDGRFSGRSIVYRYVLDRREFFFMLCMTLHLYKVTLSLVDVFLLVRRAGLASLGSRKLEHCGIKRKMSLWKATYWEIAVLFESHGY